MKIAIVGSGISGLTAASLLAPHHKITVFEANDYLGGHTNTVTVEDDGIAIGIDTGFIVFNEVTYPNFCGLLRELNVASKPTRMGFSVSCRQTRFEYNGETAWGLLSDPMNLFKPRFYQMLRDIQRFYQSASQYLKTEPREQLTVSEFASREGYSEAFIRYHLLPMGAAIWSCNLETFGEFPFEFVAQFYANHGLIQLSGRPVWRVIEGGSSQYIKALTAGFSDRIRLNTPVQSIERQEDGQVRILSSCGAELYDHVIVACHSDTALKLVIQHDSTEVEILSAFPYQDNLAVLHTDISVLPRYKRSWSSWNYLLDEERETLPTLTYQMNILQDIRSRTQYCVTLNAGDLIHPEKILGQYRYSHPIFRHDRKLMQSRHPEMINRNGISYCGAYWRNGFHEDGVVSALAACAHLAPAPAWSTSGSAS